MYLWKGATLLCGGAKDRKKDKKEYLRHPSSTSSTTQSSGSYRAPVQGSDIVLACSTIVSDVLIMEWKRI